MLKSELRQPSKSQSDCKSEDRITKKTKLLCNNGLLSIVLVLHHVILVSILPHDKAF